MSSAGFWWFGFGFLLLATLVQVSFLDWIRIGPAKPDLLLITLVWFLLDLRLASALALTLIAALLRLSITGEPTSYVLSSFLAVAFFSYWAVRQFVREDLWVEMGILGTSSLVVYTTGFIWLYPRDFFALGLAIQTFFLHVILTSVYTLSIAPFYWRWMNHFLIRCGWESFTDSME